jgi:hypothetical protein
MKETISEYSERTLCLGAGIRVELPDSPGNRHIRTTELILLGSPFGAACAAVGIGHAGRVRSQRSKGGNRNSSESGHEPAGVLQAFERLLKRSFRDQVRAAKRAENEALSVQVRSERAKEALTDFLGHIELLRRTDA